MSKEVDFLLLYPILESARQSGSELFSLLNEATSLSEPPDSSWIPVLDEACVHILEALDVVASHGIAESAYSGLREAVELTRHSFVYGEVWLTNAYMKNVSALEIFESHVDVLAEKAFGPWGAHFFQLCAPTLPASYFDPASYSMSPGRRRPAYERDHLWLKWRDVEEIGPAAIRDRWNGMSGEERKTICPRAANCIGSGEPGREVVRKALKRARRERHA